MSTGNPLAPLVRKLNSHVMLTANDQSAILELPYTLRSLSRLTYLVREGEVPGPCGVLVTGFAFRQKTSHEGARQILSIHVPGELTDLQQLFLDRADHNVQTSTAAEVALIPRKALRDLAGTYPSIRQAFAISLQVEASISREWLLNVGRRDARRRVAHFLCEIGVRLEHYELGGREGFEMPMSQEQLGDAVGLTSVHVKPDSHGFGSRGPDQKGEARRETAGLEPVACTLRLQRRLPALRAAASGMINARPSSGRAPFPHVRGRCEPVGPLC